MVIVKMLSNNIDGFTWWMRDDNQREHLVGNKHRTPLEMFEPFLNKLFQCFQSHQDFQNMV